MSEGRKQSVYVVVRSGWYSTDDRWAGADEPIRAFRDRARAEEHCRALRRERRLAEGDLRAPDDAFRVVEAELDG